MAVEGFTGATMAVEGFTGVTDRYKGVTVRSSQEQCKAEEFNEKLETSMKLWEEKGARAIWFHVNTDQADWVPLLVKKGFTFHHATREKVALLYWMDPNEPCQIPSYAHTLIGVGGMVVNDKDEILAIEERFRQTDHWKLPGGYVEPGEDLGAAAIREVKEETGIETEFWSIVAYRQGHGFNFGCSDIYTVVALKPLTHDIKICPRELSKAKWMPIQEYIESPLVHDINRHFARKFLECREKGAFIGLTTILHPQKKDHQGVYSIKFGDQQKKDL